MSCRLDGGTSDRSLSYATLAKGCAEAGQQEASLAARQAGLQCEQEHEQHLRACDRIHQVPCLVLQTLVHLLCPASDVCWCVGMTFVTVVRANRNPGRATQFFCFALYHQQTTTEVFSWHTHCTPRYKRNLNVVCTNSDPSAGQNCHTHAVGAHCFPHTSTTLAAERAIRSHALNAHSCQVQSVRALQAGVAISDARTAELQAGVKCRVVEVADAACQTESNHHLSSSSRSIAPAVNSSTGSAPDSASDTMPVAAATLLSGPSLDSAADSPADCSSADCASSGAPSSVVQISVDARGCTLAGTAGLQPSKQPTKQPSTTAALQPENGSTAESASLREHGAGPDSAGTAAGANNPTPACTFLLDKQTSAEVAETWLQPRQHVVSSTSAQTETQNVIAGASTAAADNQKPSHTHNLVAFVRLHVASRLLRVMHG